MELDCRFKSGVIGFEVNVSLAVTPGVEMGYGYQEVRAVNSSKQHQPVRKMLTASLGMQSKHKNEHQGNTWCKGVKECEWFLCISSESSGLPLISQVTPPEIQCPWLPDERAGKVTPLEWILWHIHRNYIITSGVFSLLLSIVTLT